MLWKSLETLNFFPFFGKKWTYLVLSLCPLFVHHVLLYNSNEKIDNVMSNNNDAAFHGQQMRSVVT